MANVVVRSGRIHPINRPEDSVALPVVGRIRSSAGRGNVLQYAGGARRHTRWAGESEQLSVRTAPGVDINTVKTVLSWIGETVVWRDWTGLVVWCQLQDAYSSHEIRLPTSAAAELSLTLVTTTETAEV